MDSFWILFYQDTTDDEVANEMYIVHGSEADVQAMVYDMTMQHMYEDFCWDYDWFLSNFRENPLERAMEYKTMENYDDYGHRWHYRKVEGFINFYPSMF